jgi:hypothetical protein
MRMKSIILNYLSFLLVVGRRRREESSPPPESHLIKAVRRRRQTITSGTNIYNLPSSYTINLPLSCCKNGGVAAGNSLGGCKYLYFD